MSGKYRKDIEWEVLAGIDIDDSYNDNGFYPVDVVRDNLDNIEMDLQDIIYKLKDVEGLELIDEVKKDLEGLYEKIY